MTDGRLETGGHLLRHCVLFGQYLRSLGVPVTPTQMVDLVECLRFIQIGNREDFKHSARAVLINRREHLPIFELAFERFWRLHPDGSESRAELGQILQRRRGQIQQALVANGQEPPPAQEERDEPHIDKIYTYSDLEVLRHKDFAQLDEAELAAVRQAMAAIRWDPEPRRTRRTARASHGALVDLRRTLRQSLRHGGEPLTLARRRRRYKRRPLVVLCDISGSMERYARLLLQFIYVVTNQWDRVESFVFSTRLTRITRQLRQRDVDRALDDATRAVHDWGGGTRIGEALKHFNYRWARRVLGQGAIVLIISDGWDRGDIDLLAREMDRLHRSCHRLIWLNPLLGAPNYQPLVRGIQAALPHVDDFLPVHNLASLEQLAEVLAQT